MKERVLLLPLQLCRRVLPNRAALAADWVANLAMSSRRRNFCFLNLLNLALSPFCDDICPRSSNLFVTQRAEDKSVRSSIRQVTDERCEAQGTLRRNPLQCLRVRLLGLLPGWQQNVLRHARSILYYSKDLPCRCGLGNLAPRSCRREVAEKRDFSVNSGHPRWSYEKATSQACCLGRPGPVSLCVASFSNRTGGPQSILLTPTLQDSSPQSRSPCAVAFPPAKRLQRVCRSSTCSRTDREKSQNDHHRTDFSPVAGLWLPL